MMALTTQLVPGFVESHPGLWTHVVDRIGGLVSWDFPKAEAYERHVMAGSQLDG